MINLSFFLHALLKHLRESHIIINEYVQKLSLRHWYVGVWEGTDELCGASSKDGAY